MLTVAGLATNKHELSMLCEAILRVNYGLFVKD